MLLMGWRVGAWGWGQGHLRLFLGKVLFLEQLPAMHG